MRAVLSDEAAPYISVATDAIAYSLTKQFTFDIEVSPNTPTGEYKLTFETYGSRPADSNETTLHSDVINLSISLNNEAEAAEAAESILQLYV